MLPQSRDIANAIANEEEEKLQNKESNTESPDEESESNDQHDKEIAVNNLARTFTQRSIKNNEGHYINPFLNASEDPALDPTSGKFNARAWTKTLIGIRSRDPERYPERTAGVAYKNLNVHGFGNPTDYQKTFGNYPLELIGLFNKLRGKGQRKIQILRDFDGLIKSGEMLVVLGRPGR